MGIWYNLSLLLCRIKTFHIIWFNYWIPNCCKITIAFIFLFLEPLSILLTFLDAYIHYVQLLSIEIHVYFANCFLFLQNFPWSFISFLSAMFIPLLWIASIAMYSQRTIKTHESLPLKFKKVLVRLSLCYCFISDSCSIIFCFQLVEVVPVVEIFFCNFRLVVSL